MKKPIAILVVLLLAAPALAADWSFYGSIRQATFYESQDFGDYNQSGALNGPGQTDDWGLQWLFQDNNRLGAKVKADKVRGHIELALNANSSNGGDVNRGSNGGDGAVTTRRAYGTWKFSDNATLKVGKDYGPVTNLVSGQAYDFDFGLKGQGDFYDKRPSGLFLEVGNIELAALTNSTTTSNGIAPAGSDVDWNIPRLEGRYTLKLDTFEFIPFGGFQYFKVSSNGSTLNDDLDIYSYVLGLIAKANLGAFYVTAEGAWGQNWGNANWASGISTTYLGRTTATGGTFTASSAALNAGLDDVNDAKSWMALLLAGMKMTDTLKFEAGFGYRVDNPDVNALDDAKGWVAYLQAVVTMAPGVYLVPEIGYYDYGDVNGTNGSSDDLGSKWYAGAKWQIDF